MASYRELSIEAIYELHQKKPEKHVWIDVRRPDEWAQGTIPGIQRIVLDELPAKLSEMDKDPTYIMVCRSGARSGRACELMQEMGFKDPVNFVGGMLDWYDSGYDLE